MPTTTNLPDVLHALSQHLHGMCCFCSPDHTGCCPLSTTKRMVMVFSLLLLFMLLTTLVVGIGIVIVAAGNSCSPRISTNISITPCNFDDLKGTQLEASGIVQLPNEYFLKVVVRHDKPSLCVFYRSSTNTSFTLQLITSVEESSICSPEQMMDCLPSSHVSFLGIDYFGVSVWNQQSSSVYYLIVNISTWITFQRNLTNASFNLQDLWYNAINCKEYEDNRITIVTVIFICVSVFVLAVIAGAIYLICWYMRRCRHKKYERWDIHTRNYQSHAWYIEYMIVHTVLTQSLVLAVYSSTSYQ